MNRDGRSVGRMVKIAKGSRDAKQDQLCENIRYDSRSWIDFSISITQNILGSMLLLLLVIRNYTLTSGAYAGNAMPRL